MWTEPLLVVTLLAFSPCSLGLSYFIPRSHSVCGETIESSGSFKVPEHESCTTQVRVPPKRAFKLIVYVEDGETICNTLEKSVKIVDSQGASHSICDERGLVGEFIGYDSEYKLVFDELPTDIVIAVLFLRTEYECGEVLTMDSVGVDITIHNNRDTDNCAVVLPPVVFVTVRSARQPNEIPCKRKFELGLGPHKLQMTKSYGVKCIEEKPVTLEVFCPVGLFWNLQPGSKINIQLSVPNQVEREEFEERSLSCYGY